MTAPSDYQRINELRTALGDLLDNQIPKAQRRTLAPVPQAGDLQALAGKLREAADVAEELARLTPKS
jgi:hypothetical protein